MAYVTQLIFDSKRIIPAGLISINKTYQTTGDGQKIGSLYSITLTGTIVADKGSPDSNGDFWTLGGYPPDEVVPPEERLNSLIQKQNALLDLFSAKNDGKTFEVIGGEGLSYFSCNPRIISINFNENILFNTNQYTIQLECDRIALFDDEDEFDIYISAAEESWSIEPEEEGSEEFPTTFKVSHTVNATGKRFFDDNKLTKEAWEQAKEWVKKRLGLSQIIYSGINNIPDYYGGYNHLISEQIGELAGTYSITETWVLSSGTAIEQFEISTTNSINEPYPKVSINGSITGLDQRTNGYIDVSKIVNAEIKWSGIQNSIFDRAVRYSDLNLNPLPISVTVGKNIKQGVITYSYEYNSRPANNLSETKSEVISIVDNNNADLFAVIPIPFRTEGPIIQDIYTKREKTRQLNIEVYFDYDVGQTIEEKFILNHPEYRSPQSGEIQNILDVLRPQNSKIAEHSYNWDGASHYTKTVTWTYV